MIAFFQILSVAYKTQSLCILYIYVRNMYRNTHRTFVFLLRKDSISVRAKAINHGITLREVVVLTVIFSLPVPAYTYNYTYV